MTPPGLRGYRTEEVDACCELIAAALDGRTTLTADELRHVTFGVPDGSPGYRADQVDEFLDRVRAELELRQRGALPVPATGALLTPEEVQRLRFSYAPLHQRGYRTGEVDAFLALVAATLAHNGPGSLTVQEVRATRFPVAGPDIRGYQRDEVDAFVDLVVTVLKQPACPR